MPNFVTKQVIHITVERRGKGKCIQVKYVIYIFLMGPNIMFICNKMVKLTNFISVWKLKNSFTLSPFQVFKDVIDLEKLLKLCAKLASLLIL